MDSGLAVELRGVHGEFIPGYIVGYKDPENLIFQVYGCRTVESIPQITVHPSQLRRPPKGFTHNFINGDIGADISVEVLLGKIPEDNDAKNFTCNVGEVTPSWWLAEVVKQKGDFIILDLPKPQFVSNGGCGALPSFDNVVEKSQVRPRSVQKMLAVSDFHMTLLEIPKELVEVFKDPANIQSLLRTCGQSMLVCQVTNDMVFPANISVDMRNEAKVNFLVLCTSYEGILKVETLSPEMVQILRQKAAIRHQIHEISRRCKDNQSEDSESLILDEFAVSPDLIGHSIGARGANIHRARSLDGIVSVVLIPERCTFRVAGKTKEAVQNAKNILEYANEVMQVPKEYVSRIIGQKNRHIQNLVDRVGLARIRVQSAEEATDPNCVPFVFTGTRASINDAKLLINFNIESLQEIDNLEKKLSLKYNPRQRQGDGDGRGYRRERSSKSNSEGRNGPWGGWRAADHTQMDGDGAEVSETELQRGSGRPNMHQQRPRRNFPKQPPHSPIENRQTSLPPTADGSENYRENSEDVEQSNSRTLNRSRKSNQRRNKRRQSGGDASSESAGQARMHSDSGNVTANGYAISNDANDVLPARRIGRVPLNA